MDQLNLEIESSMVPHVSIEPNSLMVANSFGGMPSAWNPLRNVPQRTGVHFTSDVGTHN